jgi:ribose transport system permease protein
VTVITARIKQGVASWEWPEGTDLLAPAAWFLALALYAATCLVSQGFFTLGHTQTLFAQASVLGTLAMAQTFVLLVGGIDLSIPWTMTMAAIVTNSLAPSTGLGLAIVAALAASIAAGTINGLGVSVLGMSPIVMTLAMNGILQGAVSTSVGGSGFINSPGSLSSFASSNTLGVPNVVWVWAVLGVLAVGLLRATVYGRSLYATGSSRRVAWLSGVRSRTVVTIAYAASACVAGLTGILLAGTLSQTYLGMGDSYLFPSIAAAVLGGVAITGGSGGYVGAVGGALAITALDFLLSAIGISGQEQEVAFGCVLLAAVAVPRLIEVAREEGILASRRETSPLPAPDEPTEDGTGTREEPT